MLINLVYLVIFFILIYVIYIAVKAINTGMQAKNLNKLEDNIKNTEHADTENESISEELIKLNDLFESEVITKEEFEKAKKKLLDK